MPEPPPRPPSVTAANDRSHQPRDAALKSLVPAAAFLLSLAAAKPWTDPGSFSLLGLVLVAPFVAGYVSAPCFLVLVAARAGVMRVLVLVSMTAVAVVTGIRLAANDDAQAGLEILLVPVMAVPLAGAVWIGQAVFAHWSRTRRSADWSGLPSDAAREPDPARPSDRLAALVIDVLVIGGVLSFPMTAMSHAKHEVEAFAVGAGAATILLGSLTAWRGCSLGQSLLGLRVVDWITLERIGVLRAFLRSFIVVLEVAGAYTLVFGFSALLELIAVALSYRSLTDRLMGTSVVSTDRTVARPIALVERGGL